MESIALAVIIPVIVVVAWTFISDALDKHEQYECRVWQQQAEDYPLFYKTTWQDAQCKHWGIPVNAPVK